MSTWWLWPTSLNQHTCMAAWFCKISKLWALHLPAVWSLCSRIHFPVCCRKFSRDARFLQVQAQILVHMILLTFPFPFLACCQAARWNYCLVAWILRIIEILKLQHSCVVAQPGCSGRSAAVAAWLIWVEEEIELLLLDAFTCSSLSWRCFLHMEMSMAWSGETAAQDKGSCQWKRSLCLLKVSLAALVLVRGSSVWEHMDVIVPLSLALCAAIATWEIAVYHCSLSVASQYSVYFSCKELLGSMLKAISAAVAPRVSWSVSISLEPSLP